VLQDKELQRYISYLEQHIANIINTKSWKITAPLRRIMELLSRK